MAILLNDLKDAMRDHGFTDMLESRMEELINDAYFDICSRQTWPFLEKTATFVTVSGTAAPAAAPTDVGAVWAISDEADNNALSPIRLDDLTKRYAGALSQTGQPIFYYLIGQQLNLYPVPDGVYSLTIRYIAIPTRMDMSTPGTTDVPLLPDRHRRAILLGAVASAYDMEDDTDLASKFDAKFEKRIATMQNDLWMRQYDRPEHLDVITEGWDYIWD